MLPSKFGAKRVTALVSLCLVATGAVTSRATEYVVKADGSGDFPTIQACADAARAGDVCAVYAGVYNEHVRTTAGGTGEGTRITFRAHGVATMQGFDIRHPFVTVQGFDIANYAVKYTGHVTVYPGGNNCQVLNNTFRDGLADVYGLYFIISSGDAADNCVVRDNKLTNLNGNFVTTAGDNHVFERNVLEFQNSRDYIRLFGANQVFRRNVFWRGTAATGTGNHPDFVQTFGGEDRKSENHLFEENWIQDLPSQFSQVNSGDGVVTKGILYSNVKNITFRRNVIANVSANANIGMSGVRFENNTFYRLSYELSGIGFSGSLTRGDPSGALLKNNVFLAGGARATLVGDSSGFYFVGGVVMSREVIGVFVTSDPTVDTAVTTGIYDDLRNNGYIDPNGKILAKATALTAASQITLNAAYEPYRNSLYDYLMRTVRLDATFRSTFVADYNFVAGAESAGFPPKRSSGCDPARTYTDSYFCEAHGINGGDPHFQNIALPLGPDGVPFTLDDGLKPRATSPLCGRGDGGSDIGAYSCDPAKVFPSTVRPNTPTNLRIVG